MTTARFVPVVMMLAFLVPAAPSGRTQQTPGMGGAQLASDLNFGKASLYFIPNRGQMDDAVCFYVQGRDKILYFSPGGITFSLDSGRETPAGPDRMHLAEAEVGHNLPEVSGRWNVKLEFVDANPDARPVGEQEAGAVVSYFKGQCAAWRTGLPTYSRIVYPGLWPGIDLAYYGSVNELKYEFFVHPGADPSRIRLAYRGVESLSVDEEGCLTVTTPVGGFRDGTPLAYQENDGRRMPVRMAYEVVATDGERGENTEASSGGSEPRAYGFRVGDFDPRLPLVLDPAILVYCGFVGGSGEDRGNGVAVDGSGNAYIAGRTYSTEATFPVAAGPDPTYNGGSYDAFVAKLNASGTLVYCGYIGGSAYDVGNAVAVDASGSAYITGTTESTAPSFPATVGPDLIYNGGYDDAFIAKVNASGTALVYCGYVGGSLGDFGLGIAVDGSGSAYIAGSTASTATTFPEIIGPDLTHNAGIYDAFVAKVNAAGTGLVYCGYIGGSGDDYGLGIALDGAGNAYVTGDTDSTESTFPVAVGPDLSQNDDVDAFVAKVNPAGSSIVYCGFIGGAWADRGLGIAVDAAGNAYVTGYTDSSEITFPVKVGPDKVQNGGFDAFVAKVNPAGSALVYCGYIGGSSYDLGSGIAVDASGSAYVTGWTRSTQATFPVTVGPDPTYNDTLNYFDAFVARINPSGTSFIFCGYIGGDSYDYGNGIAADASGNAYVTGYTWSKESTFPVVAGPDLTQNGNYDAIVARVLYYDDHFLKHAVGDFDGDDRVEAALDFGSQGIWLYDGSAWTQLSPVNPESLLAADIDGDKASDMVADLGISGLWLWKDGAWTALSAANVEAMSAGDTDADGADELVCDFGALGLWLGDGGSWSQLSAANAEFAIVTDIMGNAAAEVICDFGPTGLWLHSAGAWTQLSGVNADYVISGKTEAGSYVAADFGSTGLWAWTAGGGWVGLSGANADDLVAADTDGDADDEIIGDFGALGLWLNDGGSWTVLSGARTDAIVPADTDADGAAELASGFGALGLWLWDGGAWTQLSGAGPDSMLAGDFYGTIRDELMADFGILGVWLWHDGAWAQISPANPD